MNKDKYIQQVKKELLKLNKQKREEIFNDIAQNIHSFNGHDDEIVNHFGTASGLVNSYIEGMNYELSLTEKIRSLLLKLSNKVFFWVGIAVFIIVVTALVLINYITSDEFNYADIDHDHWVINYNIAEHTASDEDNDKLHLWEKVEAKNIASIKLYQAHVAIRYYDDPDIAVTCKGNFKKEMDNTRLRLSRNYCLIYLPQHITKIDIDQSDVVIIDPIENMHLEGSQANVRMVESNKDGYNYQITKNQSSVDDITINPKALTTITMNLYQSKLSLYEHE